MSITSEIQRIIEAKAQLTQIIKERGIELEDNILLNDYPSIVEDFPYAVKGTITPEEDITSFSLDGFNFTPTGVVFSCTDAYGVLGGIFSGFLYKNKESGIMFISETTGKITGARITPTSPVLTWSENGVALNFPSGTAYLKMGHTYEYIVIGGKE